LAFLDDGYRRVLLRARDEPAGSGGKLLPEGKIVIALVEHIGHARFDRHYLGGRDIVDTLARHFEPDRVLPLPVEAYVQLHRILGPGCDRLAGKDAAGIDKANAVAPHPSLSMAQSFLATASNRLAGRS